MEPVDLSSCRDIEPGATILAGPEPYRLLPGEDRPGLGWSGVGLNGVGVRRADGGVARFGTDIYRHRRSRPIRVRQLRAPVGILPGQVIHAGVIGQDFGHQLTQSLGRLWAGAEFPAATLAFVGATPSFPALPDYFVTVMRTLGIGNPVRLIDAPVRVEELVVPQDLCNLHRRPLDPHIKRWFDGLPGLNMSFHDRRVAGFPHRGGASGKSAALLDLRGLWADLRQAGFHRSTALPGVPREALDQWVAAVETGKPAPPFDLDDLSRTLLASRPRARSSHPGGSL